MDSFSYQGGIAIGDNNQHRLTQTLSTNVQKISQNVSAMNKLINQLQTVQDSQSIRNQLRQIQTYTQNLVKDTSSLVLELNRAPASEDPANRLARERLIDEYITTLNAFQAVQRSAAQRERDDVKRARAKTNTPFLGAPTSVSTHNNQQLIEMETTEERKQQQVTLPTEEDLSELEERERNIKQLETDILDVNQIFKELGTMIHDQGTTVDSIESSVEHTSTTVEAATLQLREASTYKNKLRKKKVYLAIIITIIVSIILIIIFSR